MSEVRNPRGDLLALFEASFFLSLLGFLDLLAQLTKVGEISKSDFLSMYSIIRDISEKES